MKVLFLCHKMPYPIHDGGAFSSYYSALGLKKNGVDLKIFAINTLKNWIEPDSLPLDFVKKTKFEFSAIDTRIKPFRAFLNLFSGNSYLVDRFYSESFKADLINTLTKSDYDIVHLEHLYLCSYISTIRKHSNARIVLRPQNVENQVWHRLLRNKMHPLKKVYLNKATKRLGKFEIMKAKEVDGIIAISPNDAEFFSTHAPNRPVVEVPVGLNIKPIRNYNFEKQFIKFPVFYHLGSMDWQPNIEGIKWFIEKVMPELINSYPNFVLRLAGKKIPLWLYKLQGRNLVIDGKIDHALTYHEDKAIMIVPLLSGGGIRVKIIEGMALGKTIISTTIGAEGIPYTENENILIADDAKTFSQHIHRCTKSAGYCRKIGENAKRFAKENYNYENTTGDMVSFYKQLF